jgi:tetratricopeptide (TPR) repeat protein
MGELPELTRRERDVLAALCRPVTSGDVFAEAASVHEIAQELVVTDAAVKQHLLHLYDKFGIAAGGGRRRVELAKEAIRRGAVGLDVPARGRAAVDEGRDAFARRDWEAAWRLLSAADAASPLDPSDLDLLGDAGFWTNRHEEAYPFRRRAYQGHLKADDAGRAAVTALMLTIHHSSRMELAVAGGWYAKAERLLERVPESAAHGWYAFVTALFQEAAGDWPAVLETAARAHSVGCAYADVDLQALGLAFQGLAETHLGQVDRGTKLLDEAMASATAGELSALASGVIYCRMLCACLDLHDFSRAGEWTELIRNATPPEGFAGLPGDCRTHRAAVLAKRGSWDEGMREAQLAVEECTTFYMPHVGIAALELGDIRLLRGDLAGAEEAFLQAHGLGVSPEPGMSLLHLARGELDAAANGLASALADLGEDRLARTRLLPVQLDIALLRGRLDDARTVVAELEETAETYGTPALGATAERARGAYELASGNAAEAVGHLTSGQRLWLRVEAPYDAARTGELLAEAYLARGDREAGLLALRTASTAYERLGATPDAERTGHRLAQLVP